MQTESNNKNEAKERILKQGASGGYMQTWHGKKIYLDVAKFNPNDVILDDVIHHLPCINRYCGATAYPYSVAQHCIALARSYRRRWQAEEDPIVAAHLQILEKQAFIHDWTEAFTNDLLAPFKQLMPEIKFLDDHMINAILKRNNLGDELDLDVVEMDRRMCRNEMDLFGSPNVPKWWHVLEPVPMVDNYDLYARSIEDVRSTFRNYADLLGVK